MVQWICKKLPWEVCDKVVMKSFVEALILQDQI